MNYRRPSLKLLAPVQEQGKEIPASEVKKLQEILNATFSGLKIEANIVESRVTPISVVFYIKTEEGFSIKKLKDAKIDIEVQLAHSIEIGQDKRDPSLMTLSLNYQGRSIVGLRQMIQDPKFEEAESPLTVAAGIDTLGEYVYLDLAETPHVLIEGVTGSGKTIFIDDILISLIYKSSPDQVRFLLIDPKIVDLKPYEGIQHLLRPVVTNMDDAFHELVAVEEEMHRRYLLFAENGVRDIDAYNKSAGEKLPHLVIVLDEYKEMIEHTEKALGESINRIAANGRIAGVHLIIATQTASSIVIPAQTKANIALRIAFANVTTVKGPDGKVRLLGSGDMMILPTNGIGVTRAQAAYVSYEEILKVVRSVRHRNVSVGYAELEEI